MKLKLYAVSLCAINPDLEFTDTFEHEYGVILRIESEYGDGTRFRNEIVHVAAAMFALSEEDARLRAVDLSLHRFSREEGWRGHSVAVSIMPVEMVEQIAALLPAISDDTSDEESSDSTEEPENLM